MRNTAILTTLLAAFLVSCGPSEEEIKKQEEMKAATIEMETVSDEITEETAEITEEVESIEQELDALMDELEGETQE